MGYIGKIIDHIPSPYLGSCRPKPICIGLKALRLTTRPTGLIAEEADQEQKCDTIVNNQAAAKAYSGW